MLRYVLKCGAIAAGITFLVGVLGPLFLTLLAVVAKGPDADSGNGPLLGFLLAPPAFLAGCAFGIARWTLRRRSR